MVNYHPYRVKELALRYYNSSKYVSIKDTIEIFNISNGSLFRWIKLNNHNKLSKTKKRFTRKTKITPEIKCYIRTHVIKRVTMNYKNLLKLIRKKYLITISKSSLYNVISRLNITRKRIKRRTITKNKKKHNKDVREYKKKAKKVDYKKLISIDESHFDNEMTSNYGWSVAGEEINKKLHIKKKVRYTLICAISNRKVLCSMVVSGSVNAEVFKEFIIKLNDTIEPNSTLLLDNARIHHAKIVKELINELGHNLFFNAPYSPEFNPIELVFSKVKYIVRTKNKNGKNLKKHILQSLKQLTRTNLNNYYNRSLHFIEN